MLIPISGITFLIDGLVLFLGFLKINSSWREKRTPLLNYFKNFFLFFSITFFLLASPHALLFFKPDIFPEIFNLAFYVGRISAFVGLAYLLQIIFSFITPEVKNHHIVPRFKNFAFILIFFFIGIATLVNLFYPNHPYFDSSTGLTSFGGGLIPMIPVFLTVLTVLGPTILYFLIKGLQSEEEFVRKRAILLAIGFSLFLLGGPAHEIIHTVPQIFLADFLVLSGFLILLRGVYLSSEDKKLTEI